MTAVLNAAKDANRSTVIKHVKLAASAGLIRIEGRMDDDGEQTSNLYVPMMPVVFAEFERGIIRERVNAGLARARANGVKLGRRRTKPSVEAQIVALRAKGDGILKIGRKLGIGTSVVQRVFNQEASRSAASQ
jgi:DNA invertase Pin-like site-specific DNA recombinase